MTDMSSGGPILVAVDFSEDSVQALVWAARQAELEGAPLIILHVIHDPAASPGFYRKPDEVWLRPLADVAKEMMDDFLASARTENPDLPPLLSADVRLVSGLPGGRICEVAANAGARLVVVGSRGRTGLQSILLGSVAQRVAQICTAPVVIVKSPEQAPRQEPTT
jgi:nucleotide-binding universal stress UspA family protein